MNTTPVEISNDRIQEVGAYLPGFQNMPLQFIHTLVPLYVHYLDKGDNNVNAFQKAWADVTIFGEKISRLGQHFRLNDANGPHLARTGT